jgi:hypothetical protein
MAPAVPPRRSIALALYFSIALRSTAMHFCLVAREFAGADFGAFQASPAGVPSFWQNQIEFINENNGTGNYSPAQRF